MTHANEPLILGIESSCDDTSAAVIRGPQVLSNVVANQALHAEVGGVVPEWASRAHLEKIHPVVQVALDKAGVQAQELDAVAYTLGPGLQGSLHVGTSFAKAYAWALGVPSIPVHHMRAHVLAHVLEPEPSPACPFLCLTVSGGHTQLVKVNAPGDMEVLGQTLDDAAGEAFDKVAKLMGLPYPGGPVVDRLAQQGDPEAFAFSRPRMEGFNWSFSGLKTQVLHFLKQEQAADPTFVERRKADICASVQAAILDMLCAPLIDAVSELGIQEVAIAGGVSANSGLRARLGKLAEAHGWKVHVPPFAYCTDNAAMVAAVGWLDFKDGLRGGLGAAPSPRLPHLRSLAGPEEG
jgi:N6-L-threonylcarbamoyladenine synthase